MENAEVVENTKALEGNTGNAEAWANVGGANSNALVQPYEIPTAKILNVVQFLKIWKVTYTDRYDPLHLPAKVAFRVEEFTWENKLLLVAGIRPQVLVCDIL